MSKFDDILCQSNFLLAVTRFLQSYSVQASIKQSTQNLKFEFHSKLDSIRIWTLLNLEFVELDSIESGLYSSYASIQDFRVIVV